MNRLRIIYHLTRGDFLERARRYSFLITLGLTIFAGYAFVPPSDARYVTLDLSGYRGVYNSAWVGSMMALLTTAWLSFAGFYLVKNTIGRDQQTGVGQIIATTPLSKPLYIIGKALSNFAFLAVMVGILVLVAMVMQLIRGEELRIDLYALLAPFLFFTLPAMAVVASLAVLFETVSWLRGGFGNLVYFFLWCGLLVSALIPSLMRGRSAVVPINDVLGLTIPLSSMIDAAKTAFPDFKVTNIELGYKPVKGKLILFRWEGVQWTPDMVLGRLMWVGVAWVIAWVAALFFDRFDPTRERPKRPRYEARPMVAQEVKVTVPTPTQVHLTPLVSVPMQFRFGPLLLAELRLMLKGLRWWWYMVALGLIIASLLTPVHVAKQRLLPMAWIWPLLIWSAMGTREVRHRTDQLVFSAAHPLRRQLPATWLSGAMVALVAGSGVAVRLILTGDWAGVLACMIATLFIPTLALALGVWSGSGKLFEVVYTLLWYIGPIKQVPAMDFMGASSRSVAAGIPLLYLIGAIVLFGLAVVGRRRQLQV